MGEIIFKPVSQNIYHPTKGDCQRCVVASIFGLELEQVPHFVLFDEKRANYILSGFYWGMSYDWTGCGKIGKNDLKKEHSINGLFEASVQNESSIKSHSSHAVVINLDGVVVHDPDKNERWKGINILKSGQLEWWMQANKRLSK